MNDFLPMPRMKSEVEAELSELTTRLGIVDLLPEALPPLDQICAIVHGLFRFQNPEDLAAYTKRPLREVVAVMSKPEYQESVRRVVAFLAKRWAESVEDPDELFRGQIRANVETLMEIRDNPFVAAKERASAAKALLDKTPGIGGKEGEAGEKFLKLLVPVGQMKAIEAALKEEGKGRMIEMMRGGDGRFGVEGEGDKNA